MINSMFKQTPKNFSKSLPSFVNSFSITSTQNHRYPDEYLHNLLHKCNETQTFEAVQSFHALTITLGPYARQPIYFTNNVISLYLSFDELHDARKVFDEMPQRNGVSYNALISGYSRNGGVEEAWEMFCGMWGCSFGPTQFSFGGLLSCHGLDLRRGGVLHGLVFKNGLFFSDTYVGTALLGMFGRNGCVDEAVRVFEDMPKKNVVTWNSVISLLGYHGFVEESMVLFCKLLSSGNGLTESTIVGLLSGFVAPEAFVLGCQVHSLVVKNGLDCDVSTSNALLSMFVKCMDFSSAERMFEVCFRDVVTYNTLIGGLARGKTPGKGLELLLSLLTEGVRPNNITYVSVINCCANLRIPICGEYIHAKAIRNSFQRDVFVGSALVDFYGKCDMLDSAQSCFDDILDKNVVSWNSLIMAYTSRSHTMAKVLFQEMLQLGYCPNEFTFSAVLKVSSVFELQQLHCLTMKLGYLRMEYVFTSLMTSYAKNGLVSDALSITTSIEMPLSVVSSNVIAATYNRAGQYGKSLEKLSAVNEPDVISWNILVSTCSHSGHYSEAFELFKHMLELQIYPDNYTIVSVLTGCLNLRCLALGTSVHGLLTKTNFYYSDTFVGNILIDMYAKCGCVEDSQKVFEVMKEKNLVTWTTVISALGNHGYACQALERFKEMEIHKIMPDSVLFVVLLSACRHGGLVKEGIDLFERMEKVYQIKPEIDHYHGLVDLLARHGHLKEAEQVIASMPFSANAFIWRSFLVGCKSWRITEALSREQLT